MPGVTFVSGTVTSFGDETADITVQLIPEGLTEVAYETIVKGNSAYYSFAGVSEGAYILRVSKAGHAAYELLIEIGEGDVSQDVTLYPLGDLNGDGKVNARDKASMTNLIKSGTYSADADLNGDGKVNARDKSIITALIKGGSVK